MAAANGREPHEYRRVPPSLDAEIYRALRRNPKERYQSIAELRRDLEHREDVAIPVYRSDVPPPGPPGDLPPWRTTATVVLLVFAVLAALDVVAELAHRSVPLH